MTDDDITNAFIEAQIAGRLAAEQEMRTRIEKATGKTKALDCCGNARICLAVDGRTREGKTLSSYSHSFFKIRKGEGFQVRIPYDIKVVPPANFQDMYLREFACEAALEVIKRRLGIKGYVRSWVD